MKRPTSIPGLYASKDGRIYQSDGTELPIFLRGRGYPAVSARSKWHYVHDLVAEAWHGPKPEGHHTHHINGDKRDNRKKNLEYMPRRIHDRLPPRESTPTIIVCIHLETGAEKEYKRIAEIAKELKVSRDTIDYAIRGSVAQVKGYKIKRKKCPQGAR